MAGITLWSCFELVVAALAHMGLAFGEMYKYQLFVKLTKERINEVDFCQQVEKVIMKLYAGHAVVTVLLFLTGHWIVGLLALPHDLWNARRVLTNSYTYDPTSVYNRKYIVSAKQEAVVTMSYQCACFIIIFFCMCGAAVDHVLHHPTLRMSFLHQVIHWGDYIDG